MPGCPRVGISRCLLGDEVRYDGTHRRSQTIIDAFRDDVEWVPVCPEVEVGMGTPREPIQLVASADGARSASQRVRLVGVTTGNDWTDRMTAWAQRRVGELQVLKLSGFVLKARSPSCGPNGVRVLDRPSDSEIAAGRGLFAQVLLEASPNLPIEDEERLMDRDVREQFLARVRRYQG